MTVLAGTIGALAATSRVAATPSGLLVFLAVGQVLGHLLMTAAGHQHTSAMPAPHMLAAHAAALLAGALLIATAERCWRAMSHTVRVLVAAPSECAGETSNTLVIAHPFASAALIAASISRRGPPVRQFT